MGKGDAYDVTFRWYCGLVIRRSEGHVEIDNHAPFAVRCTLLSEEDVVVGDIPVEDTDINEFLVRWRAI